ncbi:MAG TPA: hypothetical protein VHH73_12775 [Verrucomicrobiae bacterium]|nr:hypothetical protein [Verrucomicrobiae bacterium]
MTTPNDNPKSLTDLRALPRERQREILELLKDFKITDVIPDLAGKKIVTTEAALLEFQNWCVLRDQFEAWEADTKTLIDLLRARRPDIAEPDLERYANSVFQVQALKQNDATMSMKLAAARQHADMEERKMHLREEQLKLQREKFEFSAAEACLKELPTLRTIADDNALDLDEKIERIRFQLFGKAALPDPEPSHEKIDAE